jgi:hypothetical protein
MWRRKTFYLTSHWIKCEDERTHKEKAQNGHLLYFSSRENRTSTFNCTQAGTAMSTSWLGYGLGIPEVAVWFPAEAKYFGRTTLRPVSSPSRILIQAPKLGDRAAEAWSCAEVLRLLPHAFIACTRIILLSTVHTIVPHGQERKKKVKVRKDSGEDKKVNLRGRK